MSNKKFGPFISALLDWLNRIVVTIVTSIGIFFGSQIVMVESDVVEPMAVPPKRPEKSKEEVLANALMKGLLFVQEMYDPKTHLIETFYQRFPGLVTD